MSPAPKPTVDARVIPTGVSLSSQVALYNAAEWEIFVEEWMQGFDPQYTASEKHGGSGDMGRDVVGYFGVVATNQEWDNYQCKHYAKPLVPSDIWIELGKTCYYSWRGYYTPPRKYRFVAPKEVSPKLRELLKKPDELRDDLKKNWVTHCQSGITATYEVKLEGDFLAHIDAFDFSIFGYETLVSMLVQHNRTPFWAQRFRLALPERPPTDHPPSAPAPEEARYVQQLLGVYSEREQININSPEALGPHEAHNRHFKRSRERFYSAESLHRFSRDHLEPGSFQAFKHQVYDGVIDIVDGDSSDGLTRLNAAVSEAASLILSQSDIGRLAEVADRQGTCHHLANEGKLNWIPE